MTVKTNKGKRAGLIGILFLMAVTLFLAGRAIADSRADAQEPAVTPAETIPTDQVIVKFVESARPSSMTAVEKEQLLGQMSMTAGVELAFVRPMSGEAYVFALPGRLPAAQVEQISEDLTGMPGILYAEPDHILQTIEDGNIGRPSGNSPDLTPNDTRYNEQWHYRYVPGVDEGLNLPAAWDITTGSDQVVVGVVDTGILNHADLAGKTLPGYDFISDSEVSNDGDGRDPDPSDPGDWTPPDFCYDGSPLLTSSWHGSHVAGTIGAKTNNSLGVAGASWEAKILPVRALGRCGGYLSDILDGTRWAAGLEVIGVPDNPNPADVINLSLGRNGACSLFGQNAIDEIVAAGTTVVVAAGNSNRDAANYSPASCDNVITVAATDRKGDRAYYSNFGAVVEVSAPGGETIPLSNGVLSLSNSGFTDPENDSYAFYQGTSMASPHVAGVVALLIGENPTFTPAQVLARIQLTTRQFPSGSNCTTLLCGSGIVDAHAALLGPLPTPTPTPTDTPEPGVTPTPSPSPTATSMPSPTPTPTNTPMPGMLPAPTLLTIENPGFNDSYELNWTGVDDAMWYVVDKQVNGGAWQQYAATDDIVLPVYQSEEGSNCYRVSAHNFETDSLWSNEQCVPVASDFLYLPLVVNE